MRIRQMLGVVVLVVVCGSSALAQGRFEIQGFVGSKFGGSINIAANVENINEITFDSGLAAGLTATFNATPNFGLEFLWNRQPTTAVGKLNGGGTFPTTIDITLDQFHGNVVLTLTDEDAKLKPFLLFGLGATRGSGTAPSGQSGSDTQFSFALGGGVKYFFNEHWGLRAQMRYAPTYLYSTYGGTYCDWWGFCWTVADDHYLNQGDATVGLIFRF